MHTVREGGRFSNFLQMKMNCGTEREEEKQMRTACSHTRVCTVKHLPDAVTESTWNHHAQPWARRLSSHTGGRHGSLDQPMDHKQNTRPHNACYSSSVIQRNRKRREKRLGKYVSYTKPLVAALLAAVW